MFQLNKLSRTVKKRKRIGRGGERGGTSGRGHKGQLARSGPSLPPIFEGGQMQLTRRLPKRGFNNKNFETKYLTVNLRDLERVFKAGDSIDRESLIEHGLIKPANSRRAYLVKVLGTGKLTKKLDVHANNFSKSAIAAIEAQGGKAVALNPINDLTKASDKVVRKTSRKK